MTPTSEERREVAWRLLSEVSEGECIDFAVFRIIEEVLGIDGAFGARAARILSDFIDPTCHLVSTTLQTCMDGSRAFYHELSCGHTCVSFCSSPPSFCPECGARVAEDDGE